MSSRVCVLNVVNGDLRAQWLAPLVTPAMTNCVDDGEEHDYPIVTETKSDISLVQLPTSMMDKTFGAILQVSFIPLLIILSSF